MGRFFLFILMTLALLSAGAWASPGDSLDDVADSWVKDEIGRDPYLVDSILGAPKDLLIGRSVDPVMGSILGRINEAMSGQEGSYGRPNKRRGPCGSAAIRQAAAIASDASYSEIFRAAGGTVGDLLGAGYGVATNAVKWAGSEAAKAVELKVGEAISKQDPVDYWTSRSSEGCNLEMRVIWNKAKAQYKFLIIGECVCNEVRCWNFETREIQLDRFSVSGEGTVTPRVRLNDDKEIKIYYTIERVQSSSLNVNADCCSQGDYAEDDDGIWVESPPQPAVSVNTPPPAPVKPQKPKPQRPQTGSSDSGSSTTSTTPPRTETRPKPPKPEPVPTPITCPQCDPIKQDIEKAEGELAQAEKDLEENRKNNREALNENAKIKRRISQIKSYLGGQRGVGGESTDTTTGIRTTSYDNGEGQVEIKRFDAEGNQIGETEYRERDSTADLRVRLKQAEADLQKSDELLSQISHAIANLQNQIRELREKIGSLKRALTECIEKCKKGMVDEPAEEPKVSVGSPVPKTTTQPPKKKTPPKKPVKNTIGNKAPLLDDDDIEIELESATGSYGSNAFDARNVEEVGSGGKRQHISVSSPPPPTVTTRTTLPPSPAPAPVPSPPSAPPQPEPEVDTTIGTTPEPAPLPPLTVSKVGLVNFQHIVQTSPCPQDAGYVTVSADSGHSTSITQATVSGTLKPKLNLRIAGNTVYAQFNCSSPENGSFSGTLNLTVKDNKTGQTTSVSHSASGTVTGP